MTERSISVVTGSRAEYGLLQSSMEEIRRRDGLELSVIATGMHLSPQHGNTVEEIRADGFAVTRTVETLLDSDSNRAMAKSFGLGVAGLADAIGSTEPDVILVLGDRGEALAAGIAAAHMNVPVAHVHGGESMTGATIDDCMRHALTKFAHLHFPATEESHERILRLGEKAWRLTTVGAPGLDDVLAREYEEPDEAIEAMGLDGSRPLVLVVQHPVTTRSQQAGPDMERTLDAVTELDAQILVVYPNADAGGKAMISAIRDHPASERFTAIENVARSRYLGLLAAADVLVGNSSSGIIEAPSFGLPVVDIGPRQDGRQRAANVTSVPHETEAIREATDSALTDREVRRRAERAENPYDRGGAAERIVDRLQDVDLTEGLLRKELTY